MIQPFKIFEGLLKPRDISGRHEAARERFKKLYPTKKFLTKTLVDEFIKNLRHELLTNNIDIDILTRTLSGYKLRILAYDKPNISFELVVNKPNNDYYEYNIKIEFNTDDSYDFSILSTNDIELEPIQKTNISLREIVKNIIEYDKKTVKFHEE